MDSVGIFMANDRLRPVFRCLLSVILIVAVLEVAGVLAGTVVSAAGIHIRSFWVQAFWSSAVALAGILTAFKLMTAVFDGRPLGTIGLALHSRWRRDLLQGMAVGAAMLLATAAVEWGDGLAHFDLASHVKLGEGSFMILFFAVAAANEELMFRGYPFQQLVESFTAPRAVILSAGVFGLVHLGNPHQSWISILNTALVGVTFCIAYLRTRSLWMPIGMHFIWNFLMGFVLGLPVSGFILSSSLLVARVHGPVWLTGGDYGPEGGVLATLAILAGTIYVSSSKSIYISGEMTALLSAPAISGWPDPPVTILSDPDRDDRKGT